MRHVCAGSLPGCIGVKADSDGSMQLEAGIRMNLVHSFSELEKLLPQCEKVMVLINGGIESTHLLKTLLNYHDQVSAIAVDYGTLDRQKLSEIACYFPVELEVIDGRFHLGEVALKPAIKARALGADGVPLCSILRKKSLSLLASEYASAHEYQGIFYADTDSGLVMSDLDRAFSACGQVGVAGSPGKEKSLDLLRQRRELQAIGLSLSDQNYQEHCSSFWGRRYELPEQPDQHDFVVPTKVMNQILSSRYQSPENFSITFNEGRPVAF